MQIFPIEQSGRRCSRAHMTALLFEIFQRPHADFLLCLPRVWHISPWSKVAHHHVHNGKKKKGRRTGKGGAMPPFKNMTQNCTWDFHSRPLNQALLIWPHLTAQGRLENTIFNCVTTCQGFASVPRDELKLLESRSCSLGNEKRGVCVGLKDEPGDKKSGWSFSGDFTFNSLVLCVFMTASSILTPTCPCTSQTCF